MQDSAASLEKSMQSIEETGGDPVLFYFYKKLETEKVQKKSSTPHKNSKNSRKWIHIPGINFNKKNSLRGP